MEFPYKLGRLKDLPDFRDYTLEHPSIAPIAEKLKITHSTIKLPTTADLRPYCSPIEDQGSLGSCTANAAAGLIEYLQRKMYGKHVNASRLFIYKTTRDLMKVKGDYGAYLRTTMGAVATFGACPEEYWPYQPSRFDREPTAFCYSFAENYKSMKYVRLDPLGTPFSSLPNTIKSNIAAGIPAMFGFTVYSSINNSGTNGYIPFPQNGESVLGGHAIVAVGYDDNLKITNGSTSTIGAFLIRNSWGTSWGNKGYGWLPYKYAETGLADDWWTLLDQKWLDIGQFGFNG